MFGRRDPEAFETTCSRHLEARPTPHEPLACRRRRVFCMSCGGNQFTPLLIVYGQHEGCSRVDVDVLLGAYAIGLVPGLLVA